MERLNIVYLPIDKIIPYETNPRNNDEAVDYVEASIKEFGFRVPIIVDENNVIVAGHTRVKAAKRLGYEEIPCIRAADLDEEQIKAFRLADNKTAEMAGWDFGMLEQELEKIDGIDMTAFGFEAPAEIDIDGLFGEAPPSEKEPKKIQCPHCGEWFEV